MKTRTKAFHLGLALLALFAATGVVAQDLTITNLAQLAQEAFGPNHTLCIPFSPWQWEAFSIGDGEPWWVDCSQLPCDLLPVSTNLQAYGVQLIPVRLTKNILTGETLVQSDSATDLVASVAAPSGYQPGQQSSQDAMIWRMWLQTTNCPDCWGIEGAIPPPTVMLKTFLADVNDYATYASNIQAQAGAEVAAQSAFASSFTTGGRFMAMDDEDVSCTITDESSPFQVITTTMNTNGFTLIWTSCSDHIYVVQSESSLTPTSSWADVAWMWGSDETTAWTDINAVGQAQEFYHVVRLNPNAFNNGIPYWWAVTFGLDPLDPNLVWEDPAGDGIDNLQKYDYGLDPTVSSVVDVVVDGGSFWATNQTISLDASSFPFPFVEVSLNPAMSNATLLANNGVPLSYALPSTNNTTYLLFLQYTDAQTNTLGPVLLKTVILDTIPPWVEITSPTNSTGNQAFVHLQATVFDPNPDPTSSPTAPRPVAVWINGAQYWNQQGTQIDIPRFPVVPHTNNLITITAQDQAGNTLEASVSIYIDPSTATNAPVLSNFDLKTNTVTLLPDMSQIWVSGQMDNLDAIVTATVNGSSPITMNVLSNQFWSLVSLNPGTNTLLVVGSDVAGNASTNAFTLVRTNSYVAVITSPAFGTFANGRPFTVSGYVSEYKNAGLPNQTGLVSVTVNAVGTTLTTNGDGTVSFSTTNALSAPTVGPPVPLQVSIQWADGSGDPPLSVIEDFAITQKDDYSRSEGVGLFLPAPGSSTSCPASMWSIELGCLIDETETLFDSSSQAGQTTEKDWDNADPAQCVSGPSEGSVAWGSPTTTNSSFFEEQPDSGGLTVGNSILQAVAPCGGDQYYLYSCDEYGNSLTFRVPDEYPSDANVLLTFEGLSYETVDGSTVDLSQVTFQGQNPIGGTTSYLIKLSGGQECVIAEGSFGWPESPYSSLEVAYGCYGPASGSAHVLSFTGFSIQLVTLQVSPNPFSVCVGDTNTFTASGAPGTLTYSWSANGGTVVGTNGSQNQTAQIMFTKPARNTSVKATAGGLLGVATGSVGPTNILHVTAATTPPNRNRTTIGVGEQVTLTLSPTCGAPVYWSVTGQGTLSATNGNPITFTASDQRGSATVTATYNGYPYSIGFSVIPPSSVLMVTRTNSGFCNGNPLVVAYNADIYIQPDSVSFYNCVFGEITVPMQATGYFSYLNGTNLIAGTGDDADDLVVPGKGTHLSAPDNIAAVTTGAVYSAGAIFANIPYLYATAGGEYSYRFTSVQQSATLTASSPTNAVLTVQKAGSSKSCSN